MLRYQKWSRVLFWLAIVGVSILAILPQKQALDTHLWDKANHLLAFFTLALLIKFAYEFNYQRSFELLLVYGWLIEVAQSFTPDRSAELADVIADSIGIVVGLAIYSIYKRFAR